MAIVRWCVLVLLVLAGMLTASLTAAGDEWQAAVQWVQWQRPMLARHLPARPALHDGPTPSAGGGGYGAVARAAERVGASQWENLLRSALEDAVEPGDELQVALQQLAPAADLLRAAARAAAPSTAAAAPFDPLPLLAIVDALLVTTLRGELGVAAARDLLDVFACGVDLANSWLPIEHMLGALVLQRASAAVGDEVLARFDPAGLAVFAAGLAVADSVVHPESVWPMLLVSQLVAQLDVEGQVSARDLGLGNRWQAWRHGFSVRDSGRARTRSLVAALQRFVRDAVGADSWPARRALLAELAKADRAANADLWRPFLAGVEANEESRRLGVAQLRLLRLAVAWHVSQPLPRLDDPLGVGPLQVLEVADGVLLRSAEADLQRHCRRR